MGQVFQPINKVGRFLNTNIGGAGLPQQWETPGTYRDYNRWLGSGWVAQWDKDRCRTGWDDGSNPPLSTGAVRTFWMMGVPLAWPLVVNNQLVTHGESR